MLLTPTHAGAGASFDEGEDDMFFGGGGIPFGMDDGMGGGMPGMGGMGGGRQREAADTTALYEVLGIQKKATQSEIKKAFRKKALKTHPDKGGDVEEFKKLQAAYEVLGDEEKRAKYDQYGLEGLEGGDMPDGTDIFDMFFGGGRRRRGGGGGKRKAEDTVYPLKVSLEDLYNGKTAKLAITRNVMKGEPRKCSTCRGQGVVIQMRQIGPGMVQQLQARCPDCSGGYKVTMKKERQVLEVNVDKGAAHNTKLRFSGMGNEQPNTEPGDVVFVLQQKDHATFKRKGADLLIQKDVALVEALCGFEFVVKQLDGRTLIVKSKPGQIVRPEVSPGVPYVMCVDGEGMPKAGNPFDKGRLFCLFTIVFPPNYSLEGDAAKLLKQALPPALNNDTYDAAEAEEALLEEIDLEELGKGQGAAGGDSEDEDGDDPRQRVQCAQS